MNKYPLLILPGWGSNSERWQKVKELLEEKGMEVLVLDLPGFGSASPPPKPWGRDDYLQWIFQRVKEKNWQKFNVLGHSFGGGLAAMMASDPTFLKNGQEIEKLILCGPAIIKRKSSIKIYLFYWLTYFGKKIFSLPWLKKGFPLAQRLIYRLAGTRDYYVAEGVMKETFQKIWKEEGLEMILEKIKTPTLIIWGQKDDTLPLKDAYQLKERIKNSRLQILPKAKHSPHREAPEELARAIIEFLKPSEF